MSPENIPIVQRCKRNSEIGLDNKPFFLRRTFYSVGRPNALREGCYDQRLERYIAFKRFCREIKIINAVRITMKYLKRHTLRV